MTDAHISHLLSMLFGCAITSYYTAHIAKSITNANHPTYRQIMSHDPFLAIQMPSIALPTPELATVLTRLETKLDDIDLLVRNNNVRINMLEERLEAVMSESGEHKRSQSHADAFSVPYSSDTPPSPFTRYPSPADQAGQRSNDENQASEPGAKPGSEVPASTAATVGTEDYPVMYVLGSDFAGPP